MQLVRRGDASAFELVYERHATVAFSLAHRMTGNRTQAEDVVQEAFLSIWRSGARYDRARGSVRTWVLGIVHHRAIDELRRAQHHDRRRASDEGIEERLVAEERTDVQAARREESREVRRRSRAPRRAAPRARARVLRGLHPQRDRRHARRAARHHQGPHAPGAGQAPRLARRPGPGARVMSGRDDCVHGVDAGAFVLDALEPGERAAFERHLASASGAATRSRTSAWPPRPCRWPRAGGAAARAEGPAHGRRAARRPSCSPPRARRPTAPRRRAPSAGGRWLGGGAARPRRRWRALRRCARCPAGWPRCCSPSASGPASRCRAARARHADGRRRRRAGRRPGAARRDRRPRAARGRGPAGARRATASTRCGSCARAGRPQPDRRALPRPRPTAAPRSTCRPTSGRRQGPRHGRARRRQRRAHQPAGRLGRLA